MFLTALLAAGTLTIDHPKVTTLAFTKETDDGTEFDLDGLLNEIGEGVIDPREVVIVSFTDDFTDDEKKAVVQKIWDDCNYVLHVLENTDDKLLVLETNGDLDFKEGDDIPLERFVQTPAPAAEPVVEETKPVGEGKPADEVEDTAVDKPVAEAGAAAEGEPTV